MSPYIISPCSHVSQLGTACTHLVTGHSPRHVPAAVVLRLADGVLGHQGALDINADEDTVIVSNCESQAMGYPLPFA